MANGHISRTRLAQAFDRLWGGHCWLGSWDTGTRWTLNAGHCVRPVLLLPFAKLTLRASGLSLYSYFQVVHGKQIKVNVTNNFSNLLVSHNQATFLQSFPTPFYVPESEPPAVSAFHVVP